MNLSQDKYIAVNGNKIRYWCQGEEGPIVLLVHGIAASCEYWMYNISELAQQCRVYAVDLPGFGKSDKPKLKFTAENLAKFLHDFLQALKIEKVTLAGHSLGGAICLQFAINYPEQLEKLVLVDSAGFGQEIPFSFRILTVPVLGKLLLKFDSKALLAQAIKAYTYNRAAITAEFVDAMYEVLSLPGAKRTMLQILRQHATIFGIKHKAIADILNNLPKIMTSTLLIWGRQDRLLPPKHAQFALYQLPNATLHVFDHCGHVPQIEVKDKFNSLVLGYLL